MFYKRIPLSPPTQLSRPKKTKTEVIAYPSTVYCNKRKMEITFKRAHGRIKKPTHINSNVFIPYAPTKITIEPASSHTIDTEVTVLLPDNSNGFVTSKFRGDEIHKFDARKQLCGSRY